MDFAALLIACMSLVVASLALGWQIASWHMNGPRLRVVLKQGVAGRGGIVAGKVEPRGRVRDMTRLRQEGWEGPELIGVGVTNIGRTRLQVVGFSVDLRRGSMGLSFPQGNEWSAPLPHWVEPGSTASWYATLDDANALVRTTRSALDPNAGGAYMAVELGDGRKVRTRQHLKI